jgi:pimeloyl-ACP methyl ester carboxylesterase
VLLGTGSGPQNRDEEIFGHKPFLVLADALTRAGIAVLRVDDRGMGGSTGRIAEATISDFADDALAGIRFLREREEVDDKRIGFLGHSEGALVGLLAATRSKDVRFLIFLAGPGVPGSEVLRLQTNRMDRARGLSEPALQAEQQVLGAALDAVEAGADSSAIQAAIVAEAERVAAGLPDSLQETMTAIRQAMLGMGRGLATPWFRYFLRYDPRPDLRRLRIPVLALNGEKDLQVSSDQNLTVIEQALAEGENPDVTVQRLPGLNHLMQPANTGLPEEYGAIPITLDPSAIEAVRAWILERFAGR